MLIIEDEPAIARGLGDTLRARGFVGLELGADDYITKPFRVAEVIARARAFLRRRGAARAVQRFGECEIDLTARCVSRAGAPLELTAKEFALLAYSTRRSRRSSICSTKRRVSYAWACACAQRPMRRVRSGDSASAISRSANATGSGGARNPVSPWRTVSRRDDAVLP